MSVQVVPFTVVVYCKGLRKKRAALASRTTTLSSALREAKEEAEQIQDQVHCLVILSVSFWNCIYYEYQCLYTHFVTCVYAIMYHSC